jgi:hypothetical protein
MKETVEKHVGDVCPIASTDSSSGVSEENVEKHVGDVYPLASTENHRLN